MTLGLTDKTLRDAVRSALNAERNALMVKRSEANANVRRLQAEIDSRKASVAVNNDAVARLSKQILDLDRSISDLDYNGRIGFAPSFSLGKEDYVYVVPSRSGGRSHTARYEGTAWRCDCEGAQNRQYCWVTKALAYPGVRTAIGTSQPYITDEKGKSLDVQRYVKAVL